MHQDIGLDAFNELPKRKAVHALFECCCSVIMANALADSRPYPDRGSLFRKADAELFSLAECTVDEILQAYPCRGGRHAAHAMLRNELARLTRSRLGRMLGPDGGYNNWA